MTHARLVAVLLVITISCSATPVSQTPIERPAPTGGSSPTPDQALGLRRPTATSVPAGACQASTGRDAASIPGAQGFQPGPDGYVGFGNGPVRAAFVPDGSREQAVLTFANLPDASSVGNTAGLRFTKVLWIAEPGIQGRVLVRVLSGSPRAGFGQYQRPVEPEKFFVVPGNAGGYVYFAAPGCYGFQIDGDTFTSELVVLVR